MKIKGFAYPGFAPYKPENSTPVRVCACGKQISIYNRNERCFVCQKAYERLQIINLSTSNARYPPPTPISTKIMK